MENELFLIEYNETIERFKKAFKYMESDAPKVEKEKWMGEFYNLVNQICILIKRYEVLTGFKIGIDELINGFKVEG